MTGAAAVMTSGSAMAIAKSWASARLVTSMRGDDSSATGSKVQADIVHSDLTSSPATSATGSGSKSVAQTAAAASRRCAEAGQSESRKPAAEGRNSQSASATGSAA